MTAPVRRTRSVRMLVGLATVLGLAASTWSGGLLTARQAAPPPPAPPPVQRAGRARRLARSSRRSSTRARSIPAPGASTGSTCPKQLDRAEAGAGDGLSGRPAVQRARRLRQSDSQEGDPADRRRVRHARPRQGAVGRRARSHEPQLRVRLGERRLRALPARRAAAARREDARVERSRTIPTTARLPATAAARLRRSPRPGSGPTRSGACSARSAPTSGCAAATSFPVLIRKTEPKPIRVFLQDGRNDLNNYTGSWFVANQDMLSALEYAGYDVRHEWGDGEHNSRHATALFPAGADAGCGATGRRRSRPTRKGSRARTSSRCSCPARSGSS